MNLDEMMRFWVSLLGLDQPDPVSGNPWQITWRWVDAIPHPNGGEAVGLNVGDGVRQEANIRIRRPRSEQEAMGLEDTVVHELVHCLGERMQALLDAGKEAEAHEYLAERLAPAMVKIKGTPKAKYLAKAARNLPARAKGTRMDTKAILAMLAMIMAADTPEAKEKLLGEMKAQLEAAGGSADVAPPSVAAPPLGADPPKPPPADEKKPEPPALGMTEPDARYKKLVTESIDAIVAMRPDLTPEQIAHVKGLPTVDAAKAYFKAHPAMATKATPAPQLGLTAIPRGGEDTSKPSPSGNKKTMSLFRVMPGAKSEMAEGDGVEMSDPKTSGKLVSFSVVDAFNTIRANVAANTARNKVRAMGGAA